MNEATLNHARSAMDVNLTKVTRPVRHHLTHNCWVDTVHEVLLRTRRRTIDSSRWPIDAALGNTIGIV